MSSNTEIVRAVQIEDKTIHVHIHITAEEIQRLLLPDVPGWQAEDFGPYGCIEAIGRATGGQRRGIA